MLGGKRKIFICWKVRCAYYWLLIISTFEKPENLEHLENLVQPVGEAIGKKLSLNPRNLEPISIKKHGIVAIRNCNSPQNPQPLQKPVIPVVKHIKKRYSNDFSLLYRF